MTKAEAMEILRPYLDELYACWDRAWTRWKKEVGPKFQRPRKRTRAIALHNLVQEEVVKAFGDRHKITIIDKTRFLVQFGDRLICQFKKLDSGLRTSNVATATAKLFDDQQAPLLPGMPLLEHVNVGYCVDEFGEPQGFFVTFQRGKTVEWAEELTAPVAVPVVAFPSGLPAEGDARVRTDQSAKKEDEK
jgi:hypothetical protein